MNGNPRTTAHRTVAPRPPEAVMKLAAMGASHATRLSFMRILLRRLKSENWRFERKIFDFDKKGVGTAVYVAHGPQHAYSLVCFGHDLPPEMRSDRVIATAWDATFCLHDGIADQQTIERLRQNIPLQEAGRVLSSELSVSRANRSVRLFDHVVERLAMGQQPDIARLTETGYLMRTTAVYGSGKLGAADRETIHERAEFSAPFQVEMLSVYLTRAFILDLVEAMARKRSPDTAVRLQPHLRRSLGVGNSTGLGMAPFLINHPALLNNWIAAREEALARVRNLDTATPQQIGLFVELLQRSRLNAANWRSSDGRQTRHIAELNEDLARLDDATARHLLSGALPWNALYQWAATKLSAEGRELVAALLLEPHGELVDDLAANMSADETAGFRIDGAITIGRMREILENVHGELLDQDWSAPEANARLWYYSEEKLEPRLGEREEEPLDAYEQPLAPARDAAHLARDLEGEDGAMPLAGFLLKHPQHRHTVRRTQIATSLPYAEIRDNTIAADMLPVDLLRCKLAFFGAQQFDPRSDRWIRINMFKGAPFPDELHQADADFWPYAVPETGK
ncbi:MAG: hypothetical protein R3D32_01160 [Nitratireductor sp.]